MAATKEVLDLTDQIFNEAGLALNDSYPDRVRQLGDSSCKAGIEAAIRFLSEKSELSDDELQTLSAGNLPGNIGRGDFEAYIEPLEERAEPALNSKDMVMCSDAFYSGISAAIHYLLKNAKSQQVDLLSLVPSNDNGEGDAAS
ncbi:MAG: hypothetical protein ACYTBS_11280 [Planctomycetota bacterium]|jgi:hypothetical protein